MRCLLRRQKRKITTSSRSSPFSYRKKVKRTPLKSALALHPALLSTLNVVVDLWQLRPLVRMTSVIRALNPGSTTGQRR